MLKKISVVCFLGLFAVGFSAPPASADDIDWNFDKRLSKVEKQMSVLEQRLAALEKTVVSEKKTEPVPGVVPAPASVAEPIVIQSPVTSYYGSGTTCVGGSCYSGGYSSGGYSTTYQRPTLFGGRWRR